MNNDLEESLRRAQSAQGDLEAKQQKAAEQTRAQAQAKIGELKEISSALPPAEKKLAEAVDLSARAEALATGKTEIAPELLAFLDESRKAIQERQNILAVMRQRIEEIEANPVIQQMLREEVVREARLIELRQQAEDARAVRIMGEDGSTSRLSWVYDSLNMNTEYRRNIAGTHIGDSALVQLEHYVSSATESHTMAGAEHVASIPEAEKAIARLWGIKAEVEKDNPDIMKIDAILSEFLFERLQHFKRTLDQRLLTRAQGLYDYYQGVQEKYTKDTGHPATELHEKSPHLAWTVSQWKDSISIPLVQKVGEDMKAARAAMAQPEGYKAKTLAKIFEHVGSWAGSLLGYDGSLSTPDSYTEKV